MTKKIVKMVFFNLCIFALGFAIISNRGLGLNFLNLQLSPGKYGVACAVTFFIAGVFIYVNHLNIQSISSYMKHAEKLFVKDAVLNKLDDALEKLTIAKREDSRLNSQISAVYSMVKEFQKKLDILNQFLANHGTKVSEWKWMVEFNEESQQEILANVREVIDTSIVFDNENAKDSNLKSAVKKIQASAERIEGILKKYDEFLDVVQQVIEKKLRSSVNIGVTYSLDSTIQVLKKAYNIVEESKES